MKKTLTLTQEKLINEAFAIEAEEASKAGAIGYMARALVQATMPHSAKEGTEFIRKNGNFTLTIITPSSAGGLPYGVYPRLLLAWICTEAVRTQEKQLVLGDSLSHFMGELGLSATGGRWGSITALKKQTERLFSSNIHCITETKEGDTEHKRGSNIHLVDDYDLWWDAKNPTQAALWQSAIELNAKFFQEITERPIPIDLRALKALKRSPMALDVYSWLTYRMSYLNKRTCVPWAALEMQFGAEYKRTRDFKTKFLQQLKKVLVMYPGAKVEEGERGLILKPSPPHIPKRIIS